MNDFTEAVRKTVVVSIEVHHMNRDDVFFPKWVAEGDPDVSELWWVWVTTRSGLLPEKLAMAFFRTAADADAFVAAHPPGSEFSEQEWSGTGNELEHRHDAARKLIDGGQGPQVSGGGEDSPLALDVLQEAGVLGPGYQTSELVRSFVGEARMAELEGRHRDNGNVAAEFEYCWVHFPHSSPAYVAAAYRYHWYVTGDDFAAGYLWRDLECLVLGVERAAIKSVEMRQRAGQKGSKKSADARSSRRAGLLSAMERLTSRNPDLPMLGPTVVAALALDSCIKDEPRLWAQGRGQVEEYLGEVRRGEAGEEMRLRYEALFPPTARSSKTR